MNEETMKKMLVSITNLVESDFCYDMEFKSAKQRPFTPEDSEKMQAIISKVYTLAHCIHCAACASRSIL